MTLIGLLGRCPGRILRCKVVFDNSTFESYFRRKTNPALFYKRLFRYLPNAFIRIARNALVGHYTREYLNPPTHDHRGEGPYARGGGGGARLALIQSARCRYREVPSARAGYYTTVIPIEYVFTFIKQNKIILASINTIIITVVIVYLKAECEPLILIDFHIFY